MPPLHRDGDDEEDAGGEGEVAAALHEGEDEADEAVVRAKVERQHKEIGKKEDNVSNAEAGEESVEKVEDCSETQDYIPNLKRKLSMQAKKSALSEKLAQKLKCFEDKFELVDKLINNLVV